MDTAETPAETRREMPPFMPERLLLQESEDPRVGPGALDGIRRDLSRARSDGLSGLFSAMPRAVPPAGRPRDTLGQGRGPQGTIP